MHILHCIAMEVICKQTHDELLCTSSLTLSSSQKRIEMQYLNGHPHKRSSPLPGYVSSESIWAFSENIELYSVNLDITW